MRHSEKGSTLQKDASVSLQIVRRQYFQLIPYQVLLIVVNAINGIVDGIVASNMIGKTAMTAIGMFGPFNHLLYAVSMMLVSGAQILCGKYMGKNQGKELRNTFTVDLILSVIISIAIMALMTVGVLLNWTRAFASNELELAALNQYFLGQALGIPGLILGQQLFAFLSLENQTRRTMAATLTCVITNAISDILFVHVLRLGTFGLALGTAVSVWFFFAVMALWYTKNTPEMRFSLKELSLAEAKNIVILGYPGSLSRFMEMFRCMIVNSLILHYVGSVGLSSFAASNSVMAIFWSLPFGMMAVDRMLLCVSMGEEDRKGTLDIMHVITRWGVLFILCIAILLSLSAELLTRLFFQDPADPVYGMTVMALRLLPFCMVFSVVNQAFTVYAQIIQDKLYSTVLPVLNGAVYVVLFSWLLIPVIGMTGLYLANILNGLCCLLTICAFSASKIHRLPRNLTDLLAFPKDFGVSDEEYIDLSVHEEKEISTIAQQVEAFCLERGVERRKAVFSGLALEEMAANIFAHGFAPAHHHMEIRVTHMGEDVILRIRDNGTPFSPTEQAQIVAPEDNAKNVGLRILMDSAKDIQYQIGVVLANRISSEIRYKIILGLNVLMVRI